LKAAALCLLSAAVAIAGLAPVGIAQGLGIVPAAPPERGDATPLLFTNPAVSPLADGAGLHSTILVSGAGSYLWDAAARWPPSSPRRSAFRRTDRCPLATVAREPI
jgi:hypothetical protein